MRRQSIISKGSRQDLTGMRAALILACVSAILPSAVAAQTRDPQRPPRPTREALERELQQILAQPDFRRAMRAGDQDARSLSQWLALQLRRLFARLGGLHETNYALFLVSVIVGSAILLALLSHIGYSLARALRRAQASSPGPTRPVRRRPQTPDDLRREAEALAGQGLYREAVRSLYLALIRSLQLRGLLPHAASQTNAEHLHLLRDRASLIAAIRPFTGTYDSRWYGQRPASADDVSRCREWYEAALREVEAL